MGATYIKLNATALKRVYKKESIWWSAKYKISFDTQIKGSNDLAGYWETSSAVAEYGDILVVSTETSTRTRTITCYRWDSPNDMRWSNTITWPDNTAQYTYADFNTSLTATKTVDNNFTITASCTRTLNQYQITWKYLDTYKDPTVASNLKSTPVTYNYGDTPVMNGVTNFVNNSDVTARYKFDKWDDVSVVTGNRTITAQYKHEGKFSVELNNCTRTSGDAINNWYTYGTTRSINVKSNTNWAFDNVGTSTASRSVTVPGSLTISPGYIYVTTNGSYCIPSVKSGWHAYNTSCTWEPANYYSFEGGTTQKSLTKSLTTAGGTYNEEPQYVRVERVDTGPYNRVVNINNSTYYSKDKKVQWIATSSYSYGGEVVNDLSSGTTIVPGGVMTAPNPGYVYCVINGFRCTFKPATKSILAVGSTITWTATTNYSFAAGTTRVATDTETVSLTNTIYAKSADYKYITVNATYCSANISSGYRKLGDIITWTRLTGINFKYSFSSNIDDATATAEIKEDIASYSKTASYKWYNVTSATGTNCDAYISADYKKRFIPGWYIDGTKIYWKTNDSAYAMTTSNATKLIESIKAGNNDKSALVKRYTFTLTKNTNVSSIKVWRTSSPYQGATIGSEENPLLSSTTATTVYYGDVLKGKAIAADGYHFSNSNANTSLTYNSGSITRDDYWKPSVSANTYVVNLDLSALPPNTGISEQWLSLERNESATHYPVGSAFSYNNTVYAIIKVQGSPTGINTTASGWTQINGGQYNTYIIGSIKVTGTSSSFTITPQVVVNNYPVTITAGHGYDSVYLSADPKAVSGSPSGTTFPYNSTVYSFGKLNVYTSGAPGTLISGTSNSPGAIYRIGSKTVPAYTSSFGEVSVASNYNIATAKFTGVGKDTGSINYLRFPQSLDNYGSLSQSHSGHTIDITCNGYDYDGKAIATQVASFAYTAPYTANCTLKTHAGQIMPWNTKYDFTTGGGIAFEIDLTSNSSTYSLAGGKPVTITLASGAQMLVQNTGTTTSPRLGFSADFDLVVVSQNCHFGSYEVYGSYATAPIYIFDHNNYEYDWEGSGDGEAEGRFVMDNYTPIGIITYDSTNNSIIVSSR